MSLAERLLAIFAPLPAVALTRELTSVVSDFREQRSRDMARLIEESSTRGAELANCQRERDGWRRYARELERVCLAAGVQIPPAPDD